MYIKFISSVIQYTFGFPNSGSILIPLVDVTVPTLFSYYQEQALKSSLEKNYSVLKQALDRYQAENSERLLPDNIARRELKSILMKYLNVMTDCGFGYDQNVQDSCIPNYGDDNPNTSTTYKTYNGNKIYMYNFDDGQFVLTDGSLILLEDNDQFTQEGYKKVFISVDVNGYGRKPNRLGKDLFVFRLDNRGELLPMGVTGTYYHSTDDSYCSNTSTHGMNGSACTYKKLR